MKFLKTTMAMVLLALWVPVTHHCLLEEVFSWDFLSCQTNAVFGGGEDHDCDHDGCSVVETGKIIAPQKQWTIPAPAVAEALVSFALASSLPASPASERKPESGVPLEKVARWQFISRAAALVRAPSRLV